jgi:hypothetical protein
MGTGYIQGGVREGRVVKFLHSEIQRLGYSIFVVWILNDS